MSSNRYAADYAKRVAGCKKCKEQIPKGAIRLAKISPNPFVQNPDGGAPPDMKQYFHPKCLFDTFRNARAATKIIEEPSDIEEYGDLEKADKEEIIALIAELEASRAAKGAPKTPKAKKTPAKAEKEEKKVSPPKTEKPASSSRTPATKAKNKPKNELGDGDKGADTKEDTVAKDDKAVKEDSKYNSFYRFCKLCETIGTVSKYTDKSTAVKLYITKGDYDGDLLTLTRLLLPGIDQRVYNIKEKVLIKMFANIYDFNVDELTDHYNNSGDISVTVKVYLEKNGLTTVKKSDWSIMKADRWLNKLTTLSGDAQQTHFQFATKRMSPFEIQYLLRLVKKDLRINAGVKHILDGLHAQAYEAFQACRDLEDIVRRRERGDAMPVGIRISTPVLPMLAEACKSVEQAMAACKGDLLSEIKYDGERVQLHKDNEKFSFYSRSLKPVQEYKMEQLNEVVGRAFPGGDELILDSEVLLVDTTTGQPLPFGTLGKHKKENFKDASVCLFVFDILLYNGESLLDKPLSARKAMLKEKMTEIPHRVQFSEYETIKRGDNKHLKRMIFRAIDDGLEGLVIKDSVGKYEPGKRHWLKVKKDYLEQGSMADTADLLVLGAYYGTGSKGGLMSVFLMGVRDKRTSKCYTVTKVGNGYTDEMLEKINKELKDKMKKISRVHENIPSWLECAKALAPDFVILDPKEAPVWEITGAEFSRARDKHTADGISIRFPRVTRIRNDKDYDTATNLDELKKLFAASKQKSDVKEEDEEDDETPLYAKKSTDNKDAHESMEIDEEKNGGGASGRKRKSRADDKGGASSSDSPVVRSKKARTVVEDDAEDEKDAKTSQKEHKPPCKYGKDCFRKNADHIEKYYHEGRK